MLKVLNYKIGAPTVKEYVDRILEQLGSQIVKSDILAR